VPQKKKSVGVPLSPFCIYICVLIIVCMRAHYTIYLPLSSAHSASFRIGTGPRIENTKGNGQEKVEASKACQQLVKHVSR
jgi:hypothetical protein